MKITGIITGVAVLALAGCGDITASHPDATTPPRGGAAYDNGVGLGGIVAPGGGSGTTTFSTTATAECDSKSGVGLGSGGRTDCPTVPQ
jgi:hypothetical protein